LVVAEIDGSEAAQLAELGRNFAGDEVAVDAEEPEVLQIGEGFRETTVDSAGDNGELGERGELADGGVEAAGESGGASPGVAEVEGDDLVGVAVNPGEVAWVCGEIPGGEEMGTRHVFESFTNGLQSEEISRV